VVSFIFNDKRDRQEHLKRIAKAGDALKMKQPYGKRGRR
jgi:hypothetical protein